MIARTITRQQALLLGACALVLGANGCTRFKDGIGFNDVHLATGQRIGKQVEWQKSAEARQRIHNFVEQQSKRTLTADGAVQIALLNNPGLQATYEDLGIAQADLFQAGLPQNPRLEGEIRFPAQPKTAIETHIIQNFLDILYLPLKRHVARAEFEAAKLRVTHEVLRTAAETKKAFYDYQAAEQALGMRIAVTSATEASSDLARRRFRAGNITDLELAEERALDGESRLELAEAQTDVIDKREMLNRLMGLWGEQTAWRAEPRLPDMPSEELNPHCLESLAIERRLDLAAARQQVIAAGRNLGVVRWTSLFPEADIGLHYEREPEGTGTTGPSLGFPLPLFDWGQARRAKASAQLRQAQQRYAALAIEIRSRVRQLASRMVFAQQRVKFYREVQLPVREEATRQAQLQYNAMQIGAGELLRVKREEIETGRNYIQALHDYWEARGELEQEAGGMLPASVFAPPGVKHKSVPQTQAGDETSKKADQPAGEQHGGMHHHGQ